MDPTHLHLLLNHVPTVGFSAGIALFLAALVGRSNDLKQAALVIFVGVALVSIPTYATGNAAQLRLSDNGVIGDPSSGAEVTEALVAEHEGAAFLALGLMEITGALSWLALWQFRRSSRLSNGMASVLLVLSLALHVAEVGLIGLMVIVLATAFTGIVEEHRIGKAFEAAMPFTALLVVFFVIVAQIHDQHLFEPLIGEALALEGRAQAAMLYVATGVLSAISDNVFVATIYITEIKAAFLQGATTREQFDVLAVAINTGTNIPSVATPNGQAAFLFLLTSVLAPLIRLGYVRMVWMALPYFVVMTAVGLAAVVWLL